MGIHAISTIVFGLETSNTINKLYSTNLPFLQGKIYTSINKSDTKFYLNNNNKISKFHIPVLPWNMRTELS